MGRCDLVALAYTMVSVVYTRSTSWLPTSFRIVVLLNIASALDFFVASVAFLQVMIGGYSRAVKQPLADGALLCAGHAALQLDDDALIALGKRAAEIQKCLFIRGAHS